MLTVNRRQPPPDRALLGSRALCSPRPQPLPSAPARPQRTHVPVEFLGLARALHRRIAAAYPTAEARRAALLAPFRPVPGFRPMPRREHLRRLGERLRGQRAPCRLRIAVDSEPGRLRVTELWLMPARFEHESWDADEPALALLLRRLDIAQPGFAEANHRIAGVGLHALARRYERGADRSDRAVLADLLALAEGYPAAVASGVEFAIPAGGGQWIGAVMQASGKPVLAVRTFVDG